MATPPSLPVCGIHLGHIHGRDAGDVVEAALLGKPFLDVVLAPAWAAPLTLTLLCQSFQVCPLTPDKASNDIDPAWKLNANAV